MILPLPPRGWLTPTNGHYDTRSPSGLQPGAAVPFEDPLRPGSAKKRIAVVDAGMIATPRTAPHMDYHAPVFARQDSVPGVTATTAGAGHADLRLLQSQPDQALERGVVPEQVLRARAMDDAAALQHDRVARQRQRDLGVLLDQDEGGALLRRHPPDRPGELLDDDRRQALERLVKQQQRRVGHERARERQHLLLAAGEMAAAARAPLAQPREQIVDGREMPPPGPRRDREILLDAQRRKDFALLRHPAETGARAPMRRDPREVATAPGDAAAAHAREAHDREQQRRLADAVAAEQREAAAVRDIERQAIEHDGVAVAGAHVLKREQRVSHGASCPDRPRARARRRRSPWACPRPGCVPRPSR